MKTDLLNIKAIIVDDAVQARELLSLMIKEFTENVTIVGEAENLIQAVELIKTHKPDVVFLDIEMPGKSGLQIIDEISQEEINYDIIFTTAYNQYAVQAFRLSAIDYLLKPIKELELIEAINKLQEHKQLNYSAKRLTALSHNFLIQNDKTLCIPINHGYEYIPINKIEYIEADGAYAHIFLDDKKRKTVSKNLKYFEDILQNMDSFIKVNRSCILNLQHLAIFNKTDRGTIVTISGKEISLSRTCRTAFLEQIEKMNT